MRDRQALWSAVHDERARLVEDLDGITEEQWSTTSLCPGWSVHDVLAHLVDSATTTRIGFVRQLIAARLDFDRANEQGIERHRAADPQQTLGAFRAVVTSTATPPAPLTTRLLEAYLHGEDIRRPLGIEASYPPAQVTTALTHLARTGASLGGGKERVDGLRLCPTDAGQRIGEGDEVHGRAISLLLAVSGRAVREGELTGVGAETLMARATE